MLCADVTGARYRAKDTGDPVGLGTHRAEVVAIELDRDIRAHAGDEFVEAHLNGLLNLGAIADQRLHPFLDSLKDVLLRLDLGRPLILGLGDDIGVRGVGRHRVGAKVGVAVLGKDQCHLR